MDTLFNYFPLDIQIEILKHNNKFRRLNKTYYHEGFRAFKETYEHYPISLNEYIKNINEETFIFFWHEHNFQIKKIHKIDDRYHISNYDLIFNPRVIDPGHFNNNVKLDFHRNWMYNETGLYNFLMHGHRHFNMFCDIDTTFNILQKRNLGYIKCIDLITHDHCNDFDNMYIKICNFIYLYGIEHDIYDQQFKFRFGKLMDRRDEYDDYIKKLDDTIKIKLNNLNV